MKIQMIFQSRAAAILGIGLYLALSPFGLRSTPAAAQTTTVNQKGTIKVISGTSLTLMTDAGQQFTIDASDVAQILQFEPNATDLKSAKTIELNGISVGDRVLVTGKAGTTPTTINATRLILMKASDLAQEHAAELADWQKNGSGGIVSAVSPNTGTITISSGSRKIQIQTSSETLFHRYASDSVKFQNAQVGTLAQLRVGDQMRVRGIKSPDGFSIAAKEIVSGTFTNVAGLLTAIDATTGTMAIKDLTTKKVVTIKVTVNSDLRALPPATAATFVARIRAQGAGSARGPAGTQNMDLSQMMGQFPLVSLSALKKGDAVMVVATQSDTPSANLIVVTMLSGVETILTTAPTTTLGPVGSGGMGGGTGYDGSTGGGDMSL